MPSPAALPTVRPRPDTIESDTEQTLFNPARITNPAEIAAVLKALTAQ
ncbi:hypothetical protein [Streptomyces orinoci]|uniref:Uncharacterized protein n=1 Tax=Streptomyces orinoci TaxID=67339 RepID=A0ABV3K0X1_STRON|nr:hypothetical protein [Streptomyces orinoci]